MRQTTTQVVADTQVLVWYLTDSARLSPAARQSLEDCVADDHPIVVNSISLVEIVNAAEKARNPLTADQRDYIFEVLEQDDSPFLVVPQRHRSPGPGWPLTVGRSRIPSTGPSRRPPSP